MSEEKSGDAKEVFYCPFMQDEKRIQKPCMENDCALWHKADKDEFSRCGFNETKRQVTQVMFNTNSLNPRSKEKKTSRR